MKPTLEKLISTEKDIKEVYKIVTFAAKQINKIIKEKLKLNDFQIAKRKGKVLLEFFFEN